MARSDALDIPEPRGNRRPHELSDEENWARLDRIHEAEWALENPRAAKVLAEKERLELRAEAARRVASDSASRAFPGFSGLNLAQALALPRPEVPQLIEGLQSQGHTATLVAQYKTGKTTFAANVVRSLADTRPLLDRFDVPDLPGDIAVFDYELTAEDAFDMYGALGIQHLQRIHVESLRGRGFTLANDFHAEMTVEFLRQHGISYWVLDPFGHAMRGFGSENSNDEVRLFFSRVDQIVRESGVLGVLLPVHTGRAEVAIGEERARGATVIDDTPDVRWLLTRNSEGQRFFRAEGRSGISVNEFALAFDPGQSRLSATDMSRGEATGQRYRPGVMEFVRLNPGATTSEIKKGVEGKDAYVDAARKVLIADGAIEMRIEGSRHAHYIAEQPGSESEPESKGPRPEEAPQGPASANPNEAQGPALKGALGIDGCSTPGRKRR